MKHRAIILALAGASAALPAGAHAAEDICSRMLIQAINQFCQLLPNGLNLCQPVALVGPGAECKDPGQRTLVPVPLGQATLQPMTPWPAQTARPLAPWAAPYAQSALPTSTPPPPLTAPSAAAAPIREPVVAPVAPETILVAAPQAAGDATPTTPEIPPVAAIATPAVPASPIAPEPPLAPTPLAVPLIASVATPEPPVVAPVVAAPVVATVTTAAAIPESVAPPPAATAIVSTAVASPVTTVTPVAAPAPVTPVTTTAPSVAATDESSVDALAHFDFDSANLTEVGRAALDTWLREAPKDKSIRVSGHADRLGPEPYNLKLSLRRAEAVKQYLVSKGMSPRRIQLEAKGESDPVKRCKGEATPATKDCLAPNRRVLINPE